MPMAATSLGYVQHFRYFSLCANQNTDI
jgi:hypothetical protein